MSLDSDTQMGNFGSEEGSLRVGTVVLRTPLYHELSLQRSVPGWTVEQKCLACDRLASFTCQWNCLRETWYHSALWLLGSLVRDFLASLSSRRASRTLLSHHLAAFAGFTRRRHAFWQAARVACWRDSTATLNSSSV